MSGRAVGTGGGRKPFVLALAVVLLVAGGVVGTAAVGVGPAVDLLGGEDDEQLTMEIGSGNQTVFIEPADSPEGDAYAQLTGNDEIAVDVDGLSPLSTTQIDDLIRIGYGDNDSTANGTALVALNATGPLENDSEADVTFVDMQTRDQIAESSDELETSGLELEPGDRADVGIIVDSATSTQVSTEVRVIVNESGVSEFSIELEIDAPGEQTRDNETIVGENVTAITNVTNVGGQQDSAVAVLQVDGQQTDQETVTVPPGEPVTTNLSYETDSDDVPDGTSEDPLTLEVETGDSNATEEVLVLAEIHRYTNPDSRIVTTGNLFDAIDDWRADDISTGLLFDIIDAWRTDDPIPPSGEIPSN